MKGFTYALIGAAPFIALPALAQPSTSNTQPNNGSSSSAASSSASMSQGQLTQLQQKITADLQADGYKNVRVVPNSFLIHATNKQGSPVVMIINPDSVFAVAEVGANTANKSGNNSPNGTHGGSTSVPGSNGSSGSGSSNAR